MPGVSRVSQADKALMRKEALKSRRAKLGLTARQAHLQSLGHLIAPRDRFRGEQLAPSSSAEVGSRWLTLNPTFL